MSKIVYYNEQEWVIVKHLSLHSPLRNVTHFRLKGNENSNYGKEIEVRISMVTFIKRRENDSTTKL